ncbi:hypothetical protein QE368_001005 [Asaia bogorensis NBRC 16594]|nr:hypothetical protein [Asaia bogorensis NBRC 16594]
MKMYCEVILVDHKCVNTFFSILDCLGFHTKKTSVFRLKSCCEDKEYFFDDREEMIGNRDINNLLIWRTEEDSIFLSWEWREEIMELTIHFDGWDIVDSTTMASKIFSEISTKLYRSVEGVFFKAYFE